MSEGVRGGGVGEGLKEKKCTEYVQRTCSDRYSFYILQ